MDVYEWMAKQATDPDIPESAAPSTDRPKPRKRGDRACRRCGRYMEFGLTGWGIVHPFNEDGSLHICNPPSEDDFDVIESE